MSIDAYRLKVLFLYVFLINNKKHIIYWLLNSNCLITFDLNSKSNHNI